MWVGLSMACWSPLEAGEPKSHGRMKSIGEDFVEDLLESLIEALQVRLMGLEEMDESVHKKQIVTEFSVDVGLCVS